MSSSHFKASVETMKLDSRISVCIPRGLGILSDVWYKDIAGNLEDKTVHPCPACSVAVEKYANQNGLKV